MADATFFRNAGPFTLAELAERTGTTLAPGADPAFQVVDIRPLDQAGPGDISFLDNPKYVPAFQATQASACLVAEKHLGQAPDGLMCLVAKEPYRAYALAAQAFYPDTAGAATTYGVPGENHPGAHVHPTAQIAEGATIEPGSVVGAGAQIGAGTVLGATAVVGAGCTVGRDCFIAPGVTLSHAHLGDRVILHPGVRIGQDGFGFAMGLPHHEKVPQLGRVIVQDDVEIGANTTVDRGAGPDTVIGEGTKIDNLVQIGHNVEIGRHCIIVSQSGISGSTKLGDFVVLAAQAGVTGHLTINSGAQIAARSAVIHDVPAMARWGGAPARPVREWQRELIMIKNLGRQRVRGNTATEPSDD